jgi:hypothetical protein
VIYLYHGKEVSMAISKDNEKVQATVTKEIANKIAKLAKEEKRTLSAMTAILIEKGLEFYKK